MPNCTEGGCHRCANRDRYPPGTGYDLCICVHAEQNALLAAARFGISVDGAAVYSTMRPCFGCTKEMLQARIVEAYFLHDWAHPDPDPEAAQYALIQARFPAGIRQLDMADPDAEWAVSRRRWPALPAAGASVDSATLDGPASSVVSWADGSSRSTRRGTRRRR